MQRTTFRGWLYWLAKLLGDYRAVKTGRIAQRVGWRVSGKLTGRLSTAE